MVVAGVKAKDTGKIYVNVVKWVQYKVPFVIKLLSYNESYDCMFIIIFYEAVEHCLSFL